MAKFFFYRFLNLDWMDVAMQFQGSLPWKFRNFHYLLLYLWNYELFLIGSVVVLPAPYQRY